MSLLPAFKKTARPDYALDQVRQLARVLGEGDLSRRAALDEASGEARAILEAVNHLLDEALTPSMRLREAIDRMSAEHAAGAQLNR